MYKVVHGLTDTNFLQFYTIAEQLRNTQPGKRTAKTVSGTLEQTETASNHHFYHVRFPKGIIFLTKLEMPHQLTHLNLS